jgi:hypothetical protein
VRFVVVVAVVVVAVEVEVTVRGTVYKMDLCNLIEGLKEVKCLQLFNLVINSMYYRLIGSLGCRR